LAYNMIKAIWNPPPPCLTDPVIPSYGPRQGNHLQRNRVASQHGDLYWSPHGQCSIKGMARRSNAVPTGTSRWPTSSSMSQASVVAACPSSLCRPKEIAG